MGAMCCLKTRHFLDNSLLIRADYLHPRHRFQTLPMVSRITNTTGFPQRRRFFLVPESVKISPGHQPDKMTNTRTKGMIRRHFSIFPQMRLTDTLTFGLCTGWILIWMSPVRDGLLAHDRFLQARDQLLTPVTGHQGDRQLVAASS